MSDEPVNDVQDETQNKESAEVGKALGSLAEQGVEKSMDSNKAHAAVLKLQESQQKDAEESRKRAEALAKVTVDKADVKLIASEFNLDAKTAETHLRESQGDLRTALKSLLDEGLPAAQAH